MTSALLFLQEPTPGVPPAPPLTDVFLNLQAKLLAAVPGMITAAVVFAVFLLVAWAGRRVIAYAAPRVRADTGAVLLLSRVYYYSIIIFGLITALGTAGLNVSALVAGLGLTGFALGFALKDVLSNLVSGIMLLIYRPFNIGDQIKMGEHEGTIETIRMRDTVVRSYDGRLVIIPNTKLITEVVINNSAARIRRESLSFELGAGADAEMAREIFLRAMLDHVAVRGRVEPHILARQTGAGVTRLEGRFWYDPRETGNNATVREEVARAVKQAFDGAGVRATLLPPARQEAAQDSQEQDEFSPRGGAADAP